MSIATEIQRLQEAKADIKEAIENKGVTVASSLTISDYADLIDSIPTGTTEVESKDVDFYDYDGTRLYSYTKQEFLALNEMPANPTHDGLTSQGWNWSLSGAKTYVSNNGILDIGQNYITSDGATKFYVELSSEQWLSPQLWFGINGTATINWGDGTSESITGTNTNTIIKTSHTYSSVGKYVISISSSVEIKGGYYDPIFKGASSNYYDCTAYRVAVKKVEIGNNLKDLRTSFYYNFALETISIPTSVISAVSAFTDCYSLTHINLPPTFSINHANFVNSCYSVKAISFGENTTASLYPNFQNHYLLQRLCTPSSFVQFGNSFVNSARLLKKIVVPAGITTISNYAVSHTYSLPTIKFPSSVSSIGGTQSITDCYSMKIIDFTSATTIPSLTSTNNFYNMPSDYKIVVPDSLYDTWIVATNWSEYASHIVKESEYVG